MLKGNFFYTELYFKKIYLENLLDTHRIEYLVFRCIYEILLFS